MSPETGQTVQKLGWFFRCRVPSDGYGSGEKFPVAIAYDRGLWFFPDIDRARTWAMERNLLPYLRPYRKEPKMHQASLF